MDDSKFKSAVAYYNSLNIFDSGSEILSTPPTFESACSFKESAKAESSPSSPFVSYFNKIINNPEKAKTLKKSEPSTAKFSGCIDFDI